MLLSHSGQGLTLRSFSDCARIVGNVGSWGRVESQI